MTKLNKQEMIESIKKIRNGRAPQKFLEKIIELLKSVQINSINSNNKVWIKELIDSFREAGSREQWGELTGYWEQIETAVLPEPLIYESVQCLMRANPRWLCSVFDKCNDALKLTVLIKCLKYSDVMIIAAHAKAPQSRFFMLLYFITKYPKERTLDPDFVNIIEKILTEACRSKDEWKQWMEAFNRYPERANCIQIPLGRVLKNINKELLEIYIDSIKLEKFHNKSRISVNLCLETFHDIAPLQQRQQLWKLAFKKWSEWNFGTKSSSSRLMQEAVSTIDYAIVGFYTECLDQKARSQMLSKTFEQLAKVGSNWFATSSDLITHWNCLKSKWQIIFCSNELAYGNLSIEFLNEANLPFSLEIHEYHKLEIEM